MNILENFVRSDKIPEQCVCSEVTVVKKKWGQEDFAYHLNQEKESQQLCGMGQTVKLLKFNSKKSLSFHQHLDKSETFIVLLGKFFIEMLDLQTHTYHTFYLEAGDRVFVPRGLFHRMTAEDGPGTILEVSTLDNVNDSYRLITGN